AGRVESWLVVEGPEQAAACARDAQDAWAWDGIDGDDGELGQPSSVWTHESAVGADPAERAAIERFRKQHPAVHDVEIQRVDGTLVPFHFADTTYGGYFDPVRGGLCIEGRPPWSLRQKVHQIVRNAGGARHLLGTLFFALLIIELGLLWIAFAQDFDVDEWTYLIPLGVNSVLLGIVATVYNLDRHP
ncbi:MAG: hypothetical protein RMK74_17160, partial [Myxococcales bacterium]|nr:hypothetical protein [Myxococcales bacterium]